MSGAAGPSQVEAMDTPEERCPRGPARSHGHPRTVCGDQCAAPAALRVSAAQVSLPREDCPQQRPERPWLHQESYQSGLSQCRARHEPPGPSGTVTHRPPDGGDGVLRPLGGGAGSETARSRVQAPPPPPGPERLWHPRAWPRRGFSLSPLLLTCPPAWLPMGTASVSPDGKVVPTMTHGPGMA